MSLTIEHLIADIKKYLNVVLPTEWIKVIEIARRPDYFNAVHFRLLCKCGAEWTATARFDPLTGVVTRQADREWFKTSELMWDHVYVQHEPEICIGEYAH